MAPLPGATLTMAPLASSVTQRFPSDPAAIEVNAGTFFPPTLYSVVEPEGVIKPTPATFLPLTYVPTNQRFPSGPDVIALRSNSFGNAYELVMPEEPN